MGQSKKHFMISMSNDESCKQGIKFVAGFFHNKENIEITLLHISTEKVQHSQAFIAAAWERNEQDDTIEQASAQSRHLLKKGLTLLTKNGFSESQITQKVITKKSSTVKELIYAAESGLYDSLVMGKRYSSFLENLISESVSNEVLSIDISFPLWICREPDSLRKDVLLCADGSSSSERAADHIGYILKDQPDHHVTALLVDTGQGVNQKKLFSRIRERLNDNGIPQENIINKVIKSKQVSLAIREEIDEIKYAVVAIGWTGRTGSGNKIFSAGSKSQSLLKDLSKTAIWVVK